MSILRDFRDELGEDPEPFHRRLLRAGVRPTELAEAVQEYLREQQEVTDDGVLAPNVLRVTLGTKDHARLARYGIALPRALGTVVVETAADNGWTLLGPVKVRIDRDELVKPGAYRLVGRVEPVDGWSPVQAADATPDRARTGAEEPAERAEGTGLTGSPAGGVTDPTLIVRTGVDAGARLVLDGRRVTAGRGTGCDLIVRDTTVSREHAAFVLRGDVWWVLDLGSTNGTRINGLRAAEHPVTPGDRIELGDVVVELVEA
jgi:pSer/pThr/pTyr-binding forkhead associated (FHA) protein